MRLHVDSLGTFYEMAREGAGLAARRLTGMTGIGTRVGVTRLHFTSRSALRSELGEGGRKIGVRVGLSGGLDGTAAVLFEEEGALEVVQTLMSDVEEGSASGGGTATGLTRSAIVEVSQTMNNGFVDGWANVLDTSIDIEAPEFVAGDEPDDFFDPVDMEAAHDDLALVFRSRIEAVGGEIDFEHYLIPAHETMAQLLNRHGAGDGIEHRKLAAFDRMAQRGADKIADSLRQTSGMDATVDLRRINFIALDAIPESVSNEPLVSVAFSFDGTLGGYLLFLYDEPSARALVEAAIGEQAAALDEFGRDALQELSNIMASGMLDGWANMLGTAIDHSTPAYTHDMGAAVIDPLIVGLSERQKFAFVFDTRIDALDSAFDVEMYAIPDARDLENALATIDVEDPAEVPTGAEFAFEEIESEPSELQEVDRT